MKKVFFWFLSIFFLFLNSSYALTLSEIRTEIRRNIRDTDSSRRRYSDTVLLDYINEAQREIVNATQLLDKTSSYILTPLTTYYALPTDYIVAKQVEFEDTAGQTTILGEVSIKGLESLNPDWRDDSGQPIQYYVDNSSASAQANISYIPIPTNTSTGTVTLRYASIVTDLSSDSDIPFNSKRNLYPYHMAISYHATGRIKAIENKLDEAQFYFSLYLNYVNLIRARLGEMPNYNPSFRGSSTR